jgi:hypothetical protein
MTNEIVTPPSAVDQILQGPEGDLLRRCVERMLHEVMDAEVSSQIGAGLHERAESRVTRRNG